MDYYKFAHFCFANSRNDGILGIFTKLAYNDRYVDFHNLQANLARTNKAQNQCFFSKKAVKKNKYAY